MIEEARKTLGEQVPPARRGTRLRSVAYRAIKDAILLGIVKPDLPLVEERLASELQISRTPVREALAILEHEGLIEAVPYQGLFVKAISGHAFLEMYQTVEVIEPELARRAAQNIQDQELATLARLLDQAEQCIPHDVPGHLQACRQFQQLLGACSKNAYLTAMLLAIEERSDLYLLSRGGALPAEKMLAAVVDRRAILAALQQHDAEQAARASRLHAQAIQKRWYEFYTP